MDFRSLTCFMVTAQELNITRAAEKLNMSQPPLSNRIHNLEEELGVQLFTRSKRGLQLTEAGSVLQHRAAQILNLADKTRSELDELNHGLTGTLFLGIVEGRAPFLAAKWIAGFREEYPLVRYELWNGSSDDVIEQLRGGLADLAIIAAPYDTGYLEGIPVGSEPWVALLSEKHPLAARAAEGIPLRALVDEPLIVPRRKCRVEAIRQWFGSIGAEPKILCEQSNFVDAMAMAQQGNGISIFPQTVEQPGSGVVSGIITEPEKYAQYMLVWKKGSVLSELAREFVNYVEDLLAETGALSSVPVSEQL